MSSGRGPVATRTAGAVGLQLPDDRSRVSQAPVAAGESASRPDQLGLFGEPAAIRRGLKAYRCRKPYHPQPCWHTKCLDCGQVISAFDFNEEETLRISAGHDCGRPNSSQLTELPGRTFEDIFGDAA